MKLYKWRDERIFHCKTCKQTFDVTTDYQHHIDHDIKISLKGKAKIAMIILLLELTLLPALLVFIIMFGVVMNIERAVKVVF